VASGALSITATDGQTLWTTTTGGWIADLDLESDGSLALVSGALVLWSSHTKLTTMRSRDYLAPGWYVSSPNSRCQLRMTLAGALKLVTADHQTLWWNNTRALHGHTVLRPSGNFVTVNAAGDVVWSSTTPHRGNDFLSVTDAGTLTLAGTNGVVFWATQKQQKREIHATLLSLYNLCAISTLQHPRGHEIPLRDRPSTSREFP
jgi:NAD-dependent oxidoreductase involved in siderophore biosynthesis